MKYLKLFESFAGTDLVFEVALLLKAQEAIKGAIKSRDTQGLFPLPEDKLHFTLTSIKGSKPFKEQLKNSLPTDLVAPEAILGRTTIARRAATETGAAKTSMVIEVKNQGEFKDYVDKIYGTMGLENPEPDRFFHITIANNKENPKSPGLADPFSSIGDITEKDFNI